MSAVRPAGAARLVKAKAERDLLPRLALSDGSVEALKWLGVVLMTLDHVNKYLLHGSVAWIFDIGRLAMPIFAVVLAWNLARPGTLERGVYGRVTARLAIAGALATLPFVALGGLGWGWWPLNILATLLVAAGVMFLVDRKQCVLAAVLFLVGGLFVEFWWPALAIAVGAWSYFRRPSWPALLLSLAGFVSLYLVNHNFWALATLPLIVLASRVDLSVPRLRWVFYAFYPLHLAAIWAVRAAMSS